MFCSKKILIFKHYNFSLKCLKIFNVTGLNFVLLKDSLFSIKYIFLISFKKVTFTKAVLTNLEGKGCHQCRTLPLEVTAETWGNIRALSRFKDNNLLGYFVPTKNAFTPLYLSYLMKNPFFQRSSWLYVSADWHTANHLLISSFFYYVFAPFSRLLILFLGKPIVKRPKCYSQLFVRVNPS